MNEKKILYWDIPRPNKGFWCLLTQNLASKQKKYGILGTTHDWFSSYLSDRVQKVYVNSNLLSEKKIFKISVSLGSILGPILFLIYINDLYTCSELLILMFADDTPVLASHTNLDNLTSFVNAELKKIAEWFHIKRWL